MCRLNQKVFTLFFFFFFLTEQGFSISRRICRFCVCTTEVFEGFVAQLKQTGNVKPYRDTQKRVVASIC